MGLGGVAIAVPPYVIHPKTAVLGRAGGGSPMLQLYNSSLTMLTLPQAALIFLSSNSYFSTF